VKVAYQAPLLAAGSMGALHLIRARVRACEAEGVAILCCPEAILGGLADHCEDPVRLAIVDPKGSVVRSALALSEDLIAAAIEVSSIRRGHHVS
jgi:hypothetical protein